MSSTIEDNVKKRFGSKLEAWWDSTHGVSTSIQRGNLELAACL